MKRYINQYRNQQWLFTVYRAVDSDEYVLVAVVPGVGWYDIAMRLTEGEVDTLRRNEDEFIAIVNQFVHGREWPQFKNRRIEKRIKNLDVDEIVIMDDG